MRFTLPLILAATGLCGLVTADGGFMPIVNGVANSADQRAIIIAHLNRETLVIQTQYSGDASDFAWLIPLPSAVTAADVSTVEPEIFDALDRATAPQVMTGSTGLVCGCAGGGGGKPLGVEVWERFRVDGYDIAVLSAEQSRELQRWLESNGYEIPAGHEDTLQHYLDRNWCYAAVKIDAAAPEADDADRPGSGGGERMRPIAITFQTDSSCIRCASRGSALSSGRRSCCG